MVFCSRMVVSGVEWSGGNVGVGWRGWWSGAGGGERAGTPGAADAAASSAAAIPPARAAPRARHARPPGTHTARAALLLPRTCPHTSQWCYRTLLLCAISLFVSQWHFVPSVCSRNVDRAGLLADFVLWRWMRLNFGWVREASGRAPAAGLTALFSKYVHRNPVDRARTIKTLQQQHINFGDTQNFSRCAHCFASDGQLLSSYFIKLISLNKH